VHELAGIDVVQSLASIPDAIVVRVLLFGVGSLGTVVAVTAHTIFIDIVVAIVRAGVTGIAQAVVVSI
jgi:hypothetical protein